MFALQRETREDAEEKPELGAVSGQDARGDPGAGGPAELHEHVGVEVGAEELGSGENADAGEGLREAAAAQCADGESGEQNLQRCENTGDETDGEEAGATKFAGNPRVDGSSGGLVHITPVETGTAGNEGA